MAAGFVQQQRQQCGEHVKHRRLGLLGQHVRMCRWQTKPTLLQMQLAQKACSQQLLLLLVLWMLLPKHRQQAQLQQQQVQEQERQQHHRQQRVPQQQLLHQVLLLCHRSCPAYLAWMQCWTAGSHAACWRMINRRLLWPSA